MESRIKLSICTPVHGRHELVRKTLRSLVRYRGLMAAEFDIRIFVANKSPEIKRFCKENDIQFVPALNTPLGAKFNQLIAAGAIEADYICILGSDAFLSPLYFEAIKNKIKAGAELMAPGSFVALCADTLQTRFVRSDYVGSGLCFSARLYRAALAKHGALYRPEINKSLDESAVARLREAGDHILHILDAPYSLVLEVKSAENIWPFHKFAAHAPGDEKMIAVNFLKWDLANIRLLSDYKNHKQYVHERV